MDDDAIDVGEEYIVINHPRRAWTDGKAVRRLYRELRGDDLFSDPYRAHRPAEMFCQSPGSHDRAFWGIPSSNKVMKIVRVGTLHGQQELRDYIILGEKPTFPHHLVTIRRSHECQLDGVHSYSLAADEMGGSIVYWELDIAAKSIKEVDFVDYYKNSLRPYDYSLNTAFTAWDIERDMLAQVLLWDFSADNMIDTGHHVVYQKIEFRYGAQSCVVDHIDPGNYAPVHRGVCFAGLPGDQEGVSVRALFPRKMFLYEPFGGRKHSVHENNSWKTAPETSQLVNDPAYTKNNLYMPRVTVVELDGIVARHLRTVLKTYEDKTPTFSYCYSTFIPARRPLRFRPGERQRFDRNCIVAFGAIESLSRMYHLFVISLDTHARQHKIVIAKAYSSSVVFGWENMIDSEASKLFREALKMVKMDRPTHDCGVDCMSSLGDGVRNLYKFSKDPGLVKVIRMDESGIALTGWA